MEDAQSVVCRRLAEIICYSTRRIVVHVERDNFTDFISGFVSAVMAERGRLEAFRFDSLEPNRTAVLAYRLLNVRKMGRIIINADLANFQPCYDESWAFGLSEEVLVKWRAWYRLSTQACRE